MIPVKTILDREDIVKMLMDKEINTRVAWKAIRIPLGFKATVRRHTERTIIDEVNERIK